MLIFAVETIVDPDLRYCVAHVSWPQEMKILNLSLPSKHNEKGDTYKER